MTLYISTFFRRLLKDLCPEGALKAPRFLAGKLAMHCHWKPPVPTVARSLQCTSLPNFS